MIENALMLILDQADPVSLGFDRNTPDTVAINMEKYAAIISNADHIVELKLRARPNAKMVEFTSAIDEAFDKWQNESFAALMRGQHLPESERHINERSIAVVMVRFADALVRLGHLPNDWDDWDAVS